MGCGWWGNNILRYAVESGRSEIVGLCDVDRNFLDSTAAEVERETGAAPRKYGDFRELLDREKPGIVIVATPDHWHSLVTIAAVKAGAHVYVEKPVSHTLREGRAMVKAAREADRVVQVGTHRRVSPHNVSGREFLRSGGAGKIGMIRAFVHGGGKMDGPEPDSDPPPHLDWDMYCGPAPRRPYNRKIHPKGFRAFLDFANGTLGDWGIHWMDQILWCTDEKYPRKVFSTGGRFIRKDNTDAPDTQSAAFEFESFVVVWEHRLYAGRGAEKADVGCYFYGTEGTFHMGWRDGWTFYPGRRGGRAVHEDAQLHGEDEENIRELWADFLDAIEKGRRPVSDIEAVHLSSSVCHLGMISLKLGRSLRWDGAKERFDGDPEADKLLQRDYRAPWKYPEF